MIQINDKYSIITDGSGCTLKLTETRQKEEVDKETKKKTGKLVDYTFTDEWYFLTVEQTLKRYLQLELEKCEDIKTVLDKIEEVHTTIKQIKYA